MIRRIVLLGSVMALAASTLAAQGGTAPDLRELRQTVALVSNVDSLRAWETRTIAVARERRGDPMVHLELGFVALRLGELTGYPRRYEDAKEEFEFALATQPRWWVAHYGLAMAIIGLRATELGVIARVREMSGYDANLLASTALATSAELDSLRAEGLVDFVRRAIRDGDARRLAIAEAALDQVAGASVGKLRDVRLVRGVLHRRLNRHDLAEAYLTPMLADFPGDHEVELEVAQTRFTAGWTNGVELWYAALEGADSALMQRFRQDLVLVMPDSQLRALVEVDPAERVGVARNFWETESDYALLVTPERMRDHYRRLHLARVHYLRRDTTAVVLPLPGMREGSAEFDARGVILILHGEPHQTASLEMPGFLRNASWVYVRPPADTLLFHFVFLEGKGDAVLLESALDLFALSGQSRFMATPRDTLPDGQPVLESYGASLTAQTMQELFVSREHLTPIYSRLFDEGRRGASTLQEAERAVGARSLTAGTTWSLGFENALVADVDVVAAGEGASGRLMQVAFAIPGRSISPTVTVQGALYHVRLRAAVRDPLGAIVAVLDTVRVFRTSGVLLPHEMLVGRTAIEVPPGEYRVQAVLESERKGLVSPLFTVPVSAMRRDSLVLSELVLGTRRIPLPVVTATGDTAWINPTRSFQRSVPMQFYVELGGMPPDTKYGVELTVVRPGSSGFFGTRERTALSLKFTGVHGGGVSAIAREVALNRLEPGTYRIDVAVTAPDGTRRLRQREFTVVK